MNLRLPAMLFAAAVAAKAVVPVPTAKSHSVSASAPRHFQERESLPPLARSILSQRMEAHSQEMTELFWAVVFLEHDAAQETALAISREPSIARPLGDGDDLSSMLPARFFDLQDELRLGALDVAEAAKKGDDREIARAWGRLSEACVNCHAAYLEPEDR
jgi:hypothetical protein